MSISVRRHWTRTFPFFLRSLEFGTIRYAHTQPEPFFPTTTACYGCQLICSNWKWNLTANRSLWTADDCHDIPARLCGVSRVRTDNTPFTSCFIRAPGSFHANSSLPPPGTSRNCWSIKTCCLPTASLNPGRSWSGEISKRLGRPPQKTATGETSLKQSRVTENSRAIARQQRLSTQNLRRGRLVDLSHCMNIASSSRVQYWD